MIFLGYGGTTHKRGGGEEVAKAIASKKWYIELPST